MNYAIPPFEQVSIAIDGSDDRFPVRRIYCVGRNYRAHAIEMGADPDRDPPFSSWPADAIVENGTTIPIRRKQKIYTMKSSLWRLSEQVVRTSQLADALNHVWGYGVGIDLTRRTSRTRRRKWGVPGIWGKALTNLRPVCAASCERGRASRY